MRSFLLACAIVVSAGGDDGEAACTASHLDGLKLRFNEVQLAEGGSAAVLPGPVFYKRPLLRIPREALLLPDESLEQRVSQYATDHGPLQLGTTEGEAEQLLLLALTLLEERRNYSLSTFQTWLDAVAGEQPPLALQLSKRQQAILAGTTVESAQDQMSALHDALVALNPASDQSAEASWALGVVARRAQHVVQEDGRRVLRLIMVPELFKMRVHPDPQKAPPLVETTALAAGKERRVLLRAAERDYRAGEELFLWSGRLSDSELLLRGMARSSNFSSMKNPTGIGGKARIPENWNTNPRTPNFKEFRKFNCTSQEAFEVRLSKKGWPMRSFVRCYRVAWLLLNNWYSPKVIHQTDLLEKWPPPKKYSHEDWLGWTQADQAINSEIMEYCTAMRGKLRESMDAATAEEIRKSQNAVDKILWKLRSEESKTFKECVSLARAAGIPGTETKKS